MASSFARYLSDSSGRLLKYGSTKNNSTRWFSRPVSHPFETLSRPLFRSIIRMTRNGANAFPGNDGMKLFSKMSSSIVWVVWRPTDLMLLMTRDRSLWEHLKEDIKFRRK